MPIVTELPDQLALEIGRVIPSYAAIEHVLSMLIYGLLAMDRATGRLAIREPRATDRLDILRDLLDVKGIKPATDLPELRSRLELVQTQRDALAHNVWALGSGNRLLLGMTKGGWQPVSGQKGKTRRAITPQGVEFDADDCRELHSAIKDVLARLDLLRTEMIELLQASPGKSQPPSLPTDPQ